MRHEKQLTGVSGMACVHSSERPSGRDFLFPLDIVIQRNEVWNCCSHLETCLRMKLTQSGAKTFTGKWNLCLQIISQEVHPKYELPGMSTEFLVVSANTNWLFSLWKKMFTQEGRWINASDQAESYREDNSAGAKHHHRDCWLMSQGPESIYQQIQFGSNSDFVCLSWEATHKLWMLAALEKLEGLEARLQSLLELSISCPFCGK